MASRGWAEECRQAYFSVLTFSSPQKAFTSIRLQMIPSAYIDGWYFNVPPDNCHCVCVPWAFWRILNIVLYCSFYNGTRERWGPLQDRACSAIICAVLSDTNMFTTYRMVFTDLYCMHLAVIYLEDDLIYRTSIYLPLRNWGGERKWPPHSSALGISLVQHPNHGTALALYLTLSRTSIGLSVTMLNQISFPSFQETALFSHTIKKAISWPCDLITMLQRETSPTFPSCYILCCLVLCFPRIPLGDLLILFQLIKGPLVNLGDRHLHLFAAKRPEISLWWI